MKIKRFEDIIVWKKSQDLAVDIYTVFKGNSDYGFKNQIQNASVSISNNIAEGFDRKGDREFARFLFFAISSASEVKSMLYIAERLQYVNSEDVKDLINRCEEIGRMIRGFINSLNLE